MNTKSLKLLSAQCWYQGTVRCFRSYIFMRLVRQQEMVQLSLVRKQKKETNTCVKIDNRHLLQNTITRTQVT